MSLLRSALTGLRYARGVLSTRFWTIVAYARLRAHGATIGPGFRVRGPLLLHCHRTATIRIGRDCRIQSGFAGNPVGGASRMAFWIGAGGVLTLGDRVGLSKSTIVCMRSVTIGNEVFLGGDSKVYDTDFHSLDPDTRSKPGNQGVRTAPVTIGSRVFVGGHCIILKGATVGEGSVIGAGSVVRGLVGTRELWAGNPARLLRSLTTSDEARIEPLAQGGLAR